MTKRSSALILLAPTAAALALLAAACGGSGSSNASAAAAATTTTSNGTAGANAGALSAFRQCLAAAGVKLPSGFGNRRPPQTGTNAQPPQGAPTGAPPSGGQGFGQLTDKQRQALQTCQSKLPASARGRVGGNGGQPPQNNAAFKKYTTCLKQHGVTLGESNSQSAFKKASAACAKYAPGASG